MRCDFDERHRGRWPVRTMCRVPAVSPGGHYGRRGRPRSPLTRRREAPVVAIEEVHGEGYATREEARASLFEYIEVSSNRARQHSWLVCMSPGEYERAG